MGGAKKSLLSLAYISKARPACFMLLVQVIRIALSLAVASAGRSNAASMAMIAMTTSNSIKVKPALERDTDRHWAALLLEAIFTAAYIRLGDYCSTLPFPGGHRQAK